MKNVFTISIYALLLSCSSSVSSRGGNGGSGGGDTQPGVGDATQTTQVNSKQEQELPDWDAKAGDTEAPDNRSDEEILCQDGLAASNAPGKDDFTNIFNVICDGDTTSEDFKTAVNRAYAGEGEPSVHVVHRRTDSLFTTELLFVYALDVPLSSPKYFADIGIFEVLDGQGIVRENSLLATSVVSKDEFPGRGSVEAITLRHQLKLAEGAALYDKRTTQVNNYLLKENDRNITLSTEHLVDETNEHYHTARGILFGMRAGDGRTNLVYVTELVVKNRIDPERLVNTVLELSKASQMTIYDTTIASIEGDENQD